MRRKQYTAEDISENIRGKLTRCFGVNAEEASREQLYRTAVMTVRDILEEKRAEYSEKQRKEQGKTVYYLCMEFLMGRSLKNHLMNLGLTDAYRTALEALGVSLEEIYEEESDPGLGNGGLGRLAACFMDSLTTLAYPAVGFTICYEYGLFRQRIVEGEQIELPDSWMQSGEPWLIPRPDKAVTVRFGGHIQENWENGHCTVLHTEYDEVQALPYDMLISGYDSRAVNRLRLWKAVNSSQFNLRLFSQGEYVQALRKNTEAEVISKVLYPSDAHEEGKLLRLSQQYFLVSASLQNIIRDHLASYGNLDNFARKTAIHLNDTHPALCIPELMRILMDTFSRSWEDAWSVVTEVFTYTNHTVLPEALEVWNADLFRMKLPRIYSIVEEINRRLCADLWKMYPGDWERISRMAVIGYSQLRMANLCVAASHTVNGVSALHSEILKKDVFRDYSRAAPQKFTNVTNGIAHRRWLCGANPSLCLLLDETIGTDYRKEPQRLLDFLHYKTDGGVLERLSVSKQENKRRFVEKMQKQGITADPTSLFDVQIKRMHEYKRQLLNVMRIIARCHAVRNNPHAEILPVTYIFGGKAAPGYYMAKEIIRLIWSLGEELKRDPVLRDRIRVICLEDYNVTAAELLIPASDISEQISLAGKEASGTGCMKFMLNGALTLGTMDGANVEIAQAVGEENIYIFGLRAAEADVLWKSGYSSLSYYRENENLHAVIDALQRGFAGNSFSHIVEYLLYSSGISDPYMCLADFDSYCSVTERMYGDYGNARLWGEKSLVNIACAGNFSSDRSIREYAEKIWHVKPSTKG